MHEVVHVAARVEIHGVARLPLPGGAQRDELARVLAHEVVAREVGGGHDAAALVAERTDLEGKVAVAVTLQVLLKVDLGKNNVAKKWNWKYERCLASYPLLCHQLGLGLAARPADGEVLGDLVRALCGGRELGGDSGRLGG